MSSNITEMNPCNFKRVYISHNFPQENAQQILIENTKSLIEFSKNPSPSQEECAQAIDIISKGDFLIDYDEKQMEGCLLKTLLSTQPFLHEELLHLLVEKGCNINHTDPDSELQVFPGNTILIWTIANALYENAVKLTYFGYSLGLDVNCQDQTEKNNALLLTLKKGVRPLEGQSSNGNREIWEKLLSLLLIGTRNLNAQDANGNTALHVACFRREEAIVRELLVRGASPYIRNNQGELPRDLWDAELTRENLENILNYIPSADDVTVDPVERDLRPRPFTRIFPS